MVALADIGDAFIAPTAQAIRQYMRQAFRGGLEHYDRIVLPIAGRFQLAEMAIDAGWRAGEIQCADTNLFSSMLGYMAAGKDIGELNIAFCGDSPEIQWAIEKYQAGSHAAAVFMVMKLAQLSDHSRAQPTINNMIHAELWRDRDRYGNQFQAGAMRLAEKLRGLDYHVGDVFEIASEAANDQRALVYVDPGKIIGDPFKSVGDASNRKALITWNAPIITPFEPKTGMDKIHHDLMPANALAFFHWHARAVPEAYQERSVFVVERGASVREHVLCNRPAEANRLVKARGKTDIEAAKIPVFPKGEPIMPAMVVMVLPASKLQALYHADLWGARPKGRIGQCFFVLLDGRIAGVFGINFADVRMSRGPYVHMTFAVPAPGIQAGLIERAITGTDARDLFEAVANAPLYDIGELRVRLHSLFPFVPPWEQVGLELKHRERRDDGTYTIDYVGRFGHWESDTIVPGWLKSLDKMNESLHIAHVESAPDSRGKA